MQMTLFVICTNTLCEWRVGKPILYIDETSAAARPPATNSLLPVICPGCRNPGTLRVDMILLRAPHTNDIHVRRPPDMAPASAGGAASAGGIVPSLHPPISLGGAPSHPGLAQGVEPAYYVGRQRMTEFSRNGDRVAGTPPPCTCSPKCPQHGILPSSSGGACICERGTPCPEHGHHGLSIPSMQPQVCTCNPYCSLHGSSPSGGGSCNCYGSGNPCPVHGHHGLRPPPR